MFEEFISIKAGRPGINIRMSKFATFILLLFLGIGIALFSQLIIREISQRNIQIEKHRRTIERLKAEMRIKDKKLKELIEFKKLLDAIKNLSRNTLNKNEQEKLSEVIYKESQKYKYNWRMILAVIMTESNFRARLRSTDPSYGLMQIKYRTAKEAGKKIGVKLKNKYELYNIEKNVLIGAFYLFEQILKFDNVKKGIVAYNLGPSLTKKISDKKKSKDITTAYLKKVVNNYNFLKENF
ncbi:lytic transglycosylase domain-containing protein [Haliovirga abyssi]|uniref:Transglycosylase SLT domain-containing protein n=1 Tax=Haliovirga abyssi TaxID=2996794 RepID=A0AAU9DCV0_9FUSO|nr:transglycosylase SLT domain-containing protein [Haliovirga abyssi]BDU51160.1 hypothetical protein HLVA_17290 [Haliovirga abyssi]